MPQSTQAAGNDAVEAAPAVLQDNIRDAEFLTEYLERSRDEFMHLEVGLHRTAMTA